MMGPWTRRHTTATGLAVIVLTNAVALFGAAWNRSGEAESMLMLTQRELRQPYWGFDRENSAVALALIWRTPPESASGMAVDRPNAAGAPSWLDQAKMESLGFDMTPEATADPDGADRRLSREVLLVFELDGPAYQQSLQLARRHVADEEAIVAAGQTGEAFKRRVEEAHDRLKAEEQDNSRLFVVDAGLDATTLRAQFPDRARYAIVRGQIRPWRLDRTDQRQAAGHVEGVSIENIHVPFEFLAPFAQRQRRIGSQADAEKIAFEARIAFGRRLEPRIEGVSFAPNRSSGTVNQ